jgi:hypothetical protein
LAQAPGLSFSVTPSHPLIAPGGTLRVSIGAVQQGPPLAMDVYLVVLLPDGDTVVAVTGGGFLPGRLSQLATLAPLAAGLTLPTGFTQTLDSFITYTFTGSEPPGPYQFFLAALRPGALADGRVDAGDLLALATAQITFGPQLATAVARVEVVPEGALLTAVGERLALEARALDTNGTPVAVPAVWSSSRPDTVAVDPAGTLTAQAFGAAQIVAEAAGVRSAPVLAVVATPAPGTLLIDETQIVSPPVDPAAPPPPGTLPSYQVVLRGLPPPVGALVIGTGPTPLAGQVVAVTVNPDGTSTVTLQLVPLPQLFPGLQLDEVLDLSQAPVSFPPDILAAYDIVRTGNTFTFAPRPTAMAEGLPAARAWPGPARQVDPLMFTLGPFDCEASVTTVPIQLSTPPLFTLTINPTLDVAVVGGNLQRFVVKAEPTARVEAGLTLTAAFEGKVTCSRELLVIRISGPPSPLAFFLSGLLPIGAGFELGGKITVASLGATSRVEVKAKAEVGIVCPAGGDCSFHRSLGDFTLAYTPTVTTPSLGNLRLEPSFELFGTVKLSGGNPFLTRLRLDVVEAKLGGKLQGSFAPELVQILDETYKSSYKLSVEASARAGRKLGEFAQQLGLSSITAAALEISTDLAQSPTGAVTADRASYQTGDPVTVRVRMDAAALTFLTFYNIDRILLVRHAGGTDTVLATQEATANQSEFVFTFTAPGPLAASELYAFVDTVVLPRDLFQLEVGKAVALGLVVTPASVTVAAGGTVQFTASLAPGGLVTDVTWTVTGSGTISPTGLFTAGSTPGTFTVRATSNATPSLFGEAQVTVSAVAVLVTSTLLDISSSSGSPHYEDTAPVAAGDISISVTIGSAAGTRADRGVFINTPQTADFLSVSARGDTSGVGSASFAVQARLVFTLTAPHAYELTGGIFCGSSAESGGTVSASAMLNGVTSVSCSTLEDEESVQRQGTLFPGVYTLEAQVSRTKGPMDLNPDVAAGLSLTLTPVAAP